jgi:nucleotide-binding universal stress UspA family protein
MIRVLLGTAAGPGSERAAAWAAELTRLLDGDLEVVEAYERRSAEQSAETSEGLDARCAAELERWASRNDLADATQRTMPLAAEQALTVAAQEWDADAVVIGSEVEEGMTSLGLGSIAHRLAHHLSCPLIVVPPGETIIEGGTVVVGVDGTDTSASALRWASRVATRIGGDVVAVFSVDAMYETFNPGGWFGPDEREASKQIRHTAGIEYVERFGSDPASTLRDVAAERDAALIVVAGKRHHSLGGVLLGAVADHLLHYPTRPVAVLPHGFDDRAPLPPGA